MIFSKLSSLSFAMVLFIHKIMPNPFIRLNTTDAIKRAYRKLALQCHPDVRPDKDAAAEEFRELTKIYQAALLTVGIVKQTPLKTSRPPPPQPTSPIVHRSSMGRIDDYEMDNFGAIIRFMIVPRAILEYGGTVFATYSQKRSESNTFQFIIYPKTKPGQTLRFAMPMGIVEITLVPEG